MMSNSYLDKLSDFERNEYEEELKQKARERSKLYYQKNKQYAKESIRRCRENNKEKYRETDKKYYEENKEKILLRKREYDKNNRETIEAKQGMKIMCECGCHIRRDGLKDHLKTKKHTKLMEKIEIKS